MATEYCLVATSVCFCSGSSFRRSISAITLTNSTAHSVANPTVAAAVAELAQEWEVQSVHSSVAEGTQALRIRPLEP